MTHPPPILECVPNFSEGRDLRKIQAIATAVRAVPGVALLHTDISPAANRTVLTFAGAPEAVVEAAFQAIREAAVQIDMTQQLGVHPRIGATDVCPLVPLNGLTMQEAIDSAAILSRRVGEELGIPVYFYEQSARADHRRALPQIRSGQYEKLGEKMLLEGWQPDHGPATFNAVTGASVIGARDILVAYNISLQTQDISKAEYIARRLRESGYVVRDGTVKYRIPGLLRKVRAIGWYMADFECAQVSMNLLDYRETSPLQAWEACTALAREIGVTLQGSELIGLMPEACLLEAGMYAYMQRQEAVPEDKALLVHAGIAHMGLDKVKRFDPQEKILEYALRHAALL